MNKQSHQSALRQTAFGNSMVATTIFHSIGFQALDKRYSSVIDREYRLRIELFKIIFHSHFASLTAPCCLLKACIFGTIEP